MTSSAGAVTTKNTYDESGVPGSGNAGLFQYTGQVYLSDLSLYYYKARAYSPTLGRFLQTDPTGYDDGLNWYAYVGNDPMDRADPTGLSACAWDVCTTEPEAITTRKKGERQAKIVEDMARENLLRQVTGVLGKLKSFYDDNRCAIWESGDYISIHGEKLQVASLGLGAAGALAFAFPPAPQVKAAGATAVSAGLVTFGVASAAVTAGNISKAIAGDYRPLAYDVANQVAGAATGSGGLLNKYGRDVLDTVKNGAEKAAGDKVEKSTSGGGFTSCGKGR